MQQDMLLTVNAILVFCFQKSIKLRATAAAVEQQQ
jgi:hypothetical protein